MSNKKELLLIIKKKWLEKILSGEKTVETREIRPKTAKQYIEFKDGVNDIDNINSPVHYDQLRLCAGYGKIRPIAVVEVTGAEIIFQTYEDGEDVTYEHEGETYLACNINYSLGKVIERINC